MKIEQKVFKPDRGWQLIGSNGLSKSSQLVFVFGDTDFFRNVEIFEGVKSNYPNAIVIGCSSSGEILGAQVYNSTLVSTAIEFQKTSIKLFTTNANDFPNSLEAGISLGKSIERENLTHIVVLSDGLKVNGSLLVAGLSKSLPPDVGITGGLAGDADRFEQTLLYNGNSSQEGAIAAIGFYGLSLKVGYGSQGGWKPFGPSRLITRAEGNVLYELDNQPALKLYEELLGEQSAELPAASFYFPLSYCANESDEGIIRTILGFDIKSQSLTLAGDLRQGGTVRLTKFSYDRLIEGSKIAAKDCSKSSGFDSPEFALVISCVGRKIVLSQRTEEELESIQTEFGGNVPMTGFYSYGEISPSGNTCQLHNQTMSITTFREV